MSQVWPDVVVGHDTVTKRVTLLREALGDDARNPRYIVGARGRGYRIAVDVSVLTDETVSVDTVPPQAVSRRPSLRAAKWLGIAGLLAAVLAAAGFRAFHEWRPSSRTSAVELPGRAEPSIAVLPFRDLSPDAGQQSFADGMSQELIDILTNLPEMTVIDRSSSFQFRGKDRDIGSIARQLGVTYILQGSVRRSGARIRVVAQLIDSRDESDRWSETFERDFTETFQVQDEISLGVARALQLSVGVDDLRTIDRSMKNPAAHAAFLKGRLAMDRINRESLELAAAYTQQSLDLDPSYGPAIVSLSEIRLFQAEWCFLPAAQAFRDSEALAQKALQLAPQIGQSHAILAEIAALRDWNWTKAQTEFGQALSLNARDSATLLVGARLAAAVGNWSEAGRLASAAIAENPLSPMVENAAAGVFFRMGRNDEAIKALVRVLTIDSSFNMAHFELAKANLVAGRPEAALAAAEAEDGSVANNGRNAAIAMAEFALGHQKESDNALAALKAEGATQWPFGIAQVYAFRGEVDQAFAWLNRACDLHDEVIRVRGDPVFRVLERDPRYKTLLRRLNFST